ncbi:MAG TPA: radical SAM family heme chaperone HemW [Parasegetibacter sp.]
MAGIYLHIPFCRQACHYCNFHFSTSLHLQNEFIEALLKEVGLRASYLENQPVSSIYFGGGTPSILDAAAISTIMNTLRQHFRIDTGAEITLETNPDDINTDKLSAWKESGINRLSIGTQSFFDEDLEWMNRAHSAQQALDCIDLARGMGIDNISIDLIYGGPTLSDKKWLQNMETAMNSGITHLSCYALTVEPQTALDHMIRKNKKEPVDPEKQARQFLMLIDKAAENGWEHYEISNFAKPEFRSRHNSSYWKGEHYLGLGPSAHSFNGHSRQWNIANNALYIKSTLTGTVPSEAEELTETNRLNEYIMTSLRTIEGISLRHLSSEFGDNISEEVKRKAGKSIGVGHITIINDSLVLTREGKLFADGIAADLFF